MTDERHDLAVIWNVMAYIEVKNIDRVKLEAEKKNETN